MASPQLFATGSPGCSAGLGVPGPLLDQAFGEGSRLRWWGDAHFSPREGCEDGVGQAVGRRPELLMGFAVLHHWNL